MRKPVSFINESQMIIGTLHVPDGGSGKHPGVIICHGFTGTKVEPHRIFVKLAEKLAASGVVALRFDFRGSGDSEGHFYDATVSGEISDAQVALDYLGALPFVDSGRLGVVGLSMGGAVAACLSGRDERVRSTVLWSAVADFRQLPIFTEDFSTQLISIDTPEGERQVHDRRGTLVGRTLMEDALQLSPLAELAEAKSAVLIVHGDEDGTVPVSHADIFYSNAVKPGRLVNKQIVAGADHTYNKYEWEQEAIAATVDWLTRTLK